jgi:hypothetical protein
MGGYKPSTAQVAATRGRAHGIRADLPRLGAEWAGVCPRAGLARRTGS